AVRLPGPARPTPARRLRGRDRRGARAPPRRARRVRAERLADADPLARARRLRRGPQRDRGDAGAPGARRLHAAVLRLCRDARGAARRGAGARPRRSPRRARGHARGLARPRPAARRPLERWELWDARQATLAGAAAPSAEAAAAAGTLAYLPLFLRGAGFTVVISVLAMAIAIAGGLVLSVARRYGGPVVAAAAGVYVELFRGTPVLLQLYVLYYGLAPLLTLDAFTAAVVGLGLNYAAYESELYRAGLEAVPAGQSEAALALGMSRWLALRRIVLPQALRVALPGVANDFIALLKDSSLVSVITVVELTKQMTITAV